LKNTKILRLPTHRPKAKYVNVSFLVVSTEDFRRPYGYNLRTLMLKCTLWKHVDVMQEMRVCHKARLTSSVRWRSQKRLSTVVQGNCFEAGWTLQAIGNAFALPFRRSTVQYWVKMGDFSPQNRPKTAFSTQFHPKNVAINVKDLFLHPFLTQMPNVYAI
jgi:hypothetical protein